MKSLSVAIAVLAACGAFLIRRDIWTWLVSVNHLAFHIFYLTPASLTRISVLADCLVGISYALVLIGFFSTARKLRQFGELGLYLGILAVFACFIALRWLTYVMNLLALRAPAWYSFAAIVKLACAVVSVPTAVFFVRNFGHVILLRRYSQSEAEKAQREAEINRMIAAERAQAAQDLAEVNGRLTAVMDSTSDGILKVRYDWTIAYGNRAARIQLPDMEVDGSVWACFPALQSSEAERYLRAVMDERVTVDYENYYEPYEQWFRTHASPMEGGISIFFSDITHTKKLQEELDKERWLREKRIQALSHMAGGLAHEISNPLAIIHGRAADLQELAKENKSISASDVLSASESIVRTSDRAIRILRGLRGFGRDAAKDAMESASIREIVDECVELQQARLERHKVNLRLTLSNDLPCILCREVQIGQIVTNLLNNAFDAAARATSGERWIALAASQEGQQISIDVTDSGPGIAEELREHLMEPFFTTKGDSLGMGVGLSLSRAIAEDHGGTLTLMTGGENTCFRLSLPASETIKRATVVA